MRSANQYFEMENFPPHFTANLMTSLAGCLEIFRFFFSILTEIHLKELQMESKFIEGDGLLSLQCNEKIL